MDPMLHCRRDGGFIPVRSRSFRDHITGEKAHQYRLRFYPLRWDETAYLRPEGLSNLLHWVQRVLFTRFALPELSPEPETGDSQDAEPKPQECQRLRPENVDADALEEYASQDGDVVA
jgi:hypothetical protein